MSKLNFDVETLHIPPQVKSAILDFSNRRPIIWPNLSTKQYKVYSARQTEADVREGSEMPGMTTWAREHYDWSKRDVIHWTAQESNFCTPGSYMQVTLQALDNGGTRLRFEWDRTGIGVRGIRLQGALQALERRQGVLPARPSR